jgi:hypothetical protein
VAFLCYSKFEVDPGVWPLAKTSSSIHDTASALLGTGYWSPFAEKSVPTRTELPGGYYLICNLPARMSPVIGTLPKQSTPSPGNPASIRWPPRADRPSPELGSGKRLARTTGAQPHA